MKPRWQESSLPALLLALALVAAAGGCRAKVDEAERIRERIRAAAAAAGERDIRGVLEWVAKDFRAKIGAGIGMDGDGEVNRQQLRFLLMRYVGQGAAPTVLLRSIDVELEGARAHARVLALVRKRGGAAGPRGGVTRTQGDLLRLDCDLEQRDGEWWIVYVERRSAEAKEFLLGE